MNNLVLLNNFYSVASPKLLRVAQPKYKPVFFKNHQTNYTMTNKYSSVAPICCAQAQQGVVSHHHNVVDDEKYAKAGLGRGESMIPKHVAIALDGNRRWLKMHGRDLDYTPFFESQMKFAEYCVKWGIGTATTFIYSLKNLEYRSTEANDILISQFQIFLEKGLENFIRKGIKVSVIGETSMLPKSCQETIKQVEEATKDNTNLDFVLLMCYTAQRDIADAAKKICKKVMEGTTKLEDINEDLIGQHLSIGSSRPPFDLFIRTGGQFRVGAISSWHIAHTEIYVSDTHAPAFDEHVFLDALRSFQQRLRLFGK